VAHEALTIHCPCVSECSPSTVTGCVTKLPHDRIEGLNTRISSGRARGSVEMNASRVSERVSIMRLGSERNSWRTAVEASYSIFGNGVDRNHNRRVDLPQENPPPPTSERSQYSRKCLSCVRSCTARSFGKASFATTEGCWLLCSCSNSSTGVR
jgi:hypothetical protein